MSLATNWLCFWSYNFQWQSWVYANVRFDSIFSLQNLYNQTLYSWLKLYSQPSWWVLFICSIPFLHWSIHSILSFHSFFIPFHSFHPFLPFHSSFHFFIPPPPLWIPFHYSIPVPVSFQFHSIVDSSFRPSIPFHESIPLSRCSDPFIQNLFHFPFLPFHSFHFT